jgi:hypothetical protein
MGKREQKRVGLAVFGAVGLALALLIVFFKPQHELLRSTNEKAQPAAPSVVAPGVVEPATDEVMLANEIGGTTI